MPWLQKVYKLPPIFYLDTWPLGDPVCVILDPDIASQVTLQPSLPKHPALEEIVLPLTGRESLLTIEGKAHKQWRNVFNLGFSNSHLMTLVDGIVEDSLVLLDILDKHADAGDMFQMEEVATRFTVDVIGRVVLYVGHTQRCLILSDALFSADDYRDASMNAQKSENEFVTAFRQTMSWFLKQPEYNPFNYFNPLRPIIHEKNRRTMDRYLGKVIDDRFAISHEQVVSKDAINKRRPRPIIDLALETYTMESGEGSEKKTTIEAGFKAAVINHIKLFIFAGHDTTASTVCYAIYELSKYPEVVTKALKEYDAVFGLDTTQTAALLKEDPYLVNKLPYTLAIIKETLRLWAPASTLRKGSPGYFLHHDGKDYPTEGFVLWPVIYALQRDPTLWPSPNSFIPERWMVDEGDPLYPPKGAWRPFELGPRSCIGQDLALLESKIILVLMLRHFKIEPAYDELDSKTTSQDIRVTPDGERAHQVMIATAKPAEGMPVRVQRK